MVAVDLGQAQDFSAICISEARRVNPGSTGVAEYAHRVGHLARWPLHTPYRTVAQHIAHLCRLLPAPPILCIDFTGVGAAVAELILEEQPPRELVAAGDHHRRGEARRTPTTAGG